jgi:hypothetical protein
MSLGPSAATQRQPAPFEAGRKRAVIGFRLWCREFFPTVEV